MTGRNGPKYPTESRYKPGKKRVLAVALAMSLQLWMPMSGLCAVSSSDDSSAESDSPSGTLLLPLTPKLDVTPSESTTTGADKEESADKGESAPKAVTAGSDTVVEPGTEIKTVAPQPQGGPPLKQNAGLKKAPDKFDVEIDIEDDPSLADAVSEDTLKGAIQIVADDTEYDQEKNTFLGTGNAVALIGGQDSKLEADMILYDQNAEEIDARGNVRITRDGQVTLGSSFKFNVNKDEYLITNPDTEINGATVIARKAYGTNEGILFRKGEMTMPEPVYLYKNTMMAPISYSTTVSQKKQHPDAFVPEKASFKFKARKMVYEKYKTDGGNLTVFGGRLQNGSFSIPVPRFTASLTKQDNTVTFPIVPSLTNNLQIGGMHFGPKFNTAMGKTGILSWSPMIQLGGRNLDGTSVTGSSGIGLSGRVSFNSRKTRFNLATGSVNHLLVADFTHNIRKGLRFDAGINRFLEDGVFGYRRARMAAEIVDNHAVGKIPYINGIKFRTSAGAYQDNPQLINLNPQYAQLFGGTQTSTAFKSAMKVQEQVTAMSHPLLNIGDDKLGVKAYIYGGLAGRAYSTGDRSGLAQIGPMMDFRLKKVNLRATYTESAIRGSTPFVFDQYIQGQRSTSVFGDVKVAKYLTLGGGLGYNFNSSLFYQKSITAAIGPEDFKLLVSRDMIRGMNRVGFDVLYGAPIPFDKLVLKGSPDHGQLGGI